jgi:hypothetical protein
MFKLGMTQGGVRPSAIAVRTPNNALLKSYLSTAGSTLIANYSGDTGLFKDTGTTYCTASGDAIYQWQDQSGNNFHLSQATLANRLAYYPNQLNGLPTVRLNGTTSYMENQSAMYSTWPAITVFVLIKPTTVTTAGTWIDAYNASTTLGRYVIRTGFTSGYVSWYAGSFVQGPAATASAWNKIDAVFNGSSSYCRNNGGSDVGPSNIGTTASPFGGYGIRIGQGGSGGTFASGDIAEIIYASGTLTSAVRTQVDAYLQRKWGI